MSDHDEDVRSSEALGDLVDQAPGPTRVNSLASTSAAATAGGRHVSSSRRFLLAAGAAAILLLVVGWFIVVAPGRGSEQTAPEMAGRRQESAPPRSVNGTSDPYHLWIHAGEDGAADGPVELTALLHGALVVAEGPKCYLLEMGGRRYPVLWPAGTSSNGAEGVRLPDGHLVRMGDQIGGEGGVVSIDALEPEVPPDCRPAGSDAVSFNANSRISHS